MAQIYISPSSNIPKYSSMINNGDSVQNNSKCLSVRLNKVHISNVIAGEIGETELYKNSFILLIFMF